MVNNILFLLSQPRSGSTMLQLILGSNNNIKTSPENSLLLKYLYTYKHDDITNFDPIYFNHAHEEFLNLTVSKNINLKIKSLAYEVYSSLCDKKYMYYLDKSPRYYHILDNLLNTFNDSKFIFLLRNPLAVFNSIIDYHYKDNLSKPFSRYTCHDLFGCLKKFEIIWNKRDIFNNILFIKYEDLVSDANNVINSIDTFLELDTRTKTSYNINDSILNSSFADPCAKILNKPNNRSVDKWLLNLVTYQRKNLFLFYSKFIESLNIVKDNYDISKNISEINNSKVSLQPYFIRTHKSFKNSFQFIN